MTIRFLTAASVLALVSACSSQPGPSSLNPLDAGYEAFRAGDYASAEAAYDQALAGSPDNAVALLGLAEVYEATGRMSQAAELYRRVDASRVGTIRVYNDGFVRQTGVTEVATRRLGVMGAPAVASVPSVGVPLPAYTAAPLAPVAVDRLPSTYTEQPTLISALPETPTYALDNEGIVYYADPQATQPISEPIYGSPQEVAVYAPAPVETTIYAPAPVESYAAPVYAPVPVAPTVTTYEPTPAIYEPAPAVYQPAPVSYQPAPPVQQTTAPVYAPLPQQRAYTPASPVTAAPVGQPGYGVVDGNFVYISAEDIAAGATAPSPAPAGPAADSYGIPTPITTSPVPAGTPDTYSAPRGVDVMNGIPMIDLN